MIVNFSKLLRNSFKERIDVVRKWPERLEEIQAWYNEYFRVWESGRLEEFRYFQALKVVLHNEISEETTVGDAFERLSSRRAFISFFQNYYDEILRTDKEQAAAGRRVASGPGEFVDAVIEKVKEARKPARRGILDQRYGYLIAKGVEGAWDRYSEDGVTEPRIIQTVRELLEEEGARSEIQSRYFTDFALEVVAEARRFLDGTLEWGNALGLDRYAQPEMVVVAVEKHRQAATRSPEEAERFLQYLAGDHPNQIAIVNKAKKNRFQITNLEEWLVARQEFPTLFRVSDGTVDFGRGFA